MIGGASAISAGPDNGANDKLALRFSNPTRHRNTREALDSLNSSPSTARRVNICGHGNLGYVETGKGQLPQFDAARMFGIWSLSYNAAEIATLSRRDFALFSIYSCDTGAGQSGAEFLFRLANALGRATRARTGLMFIDTHEITYEPGSTWQVAFPGSKPTSIPTPSGDNFRRNGTEIHFPFKRGLAPLIASSIEGIKIHRLSGSSPKETYIDREADVLELLETLFYSEPLASSGIVPAFLTAEITLGLVDSKGKTSEVTLDVFNDRIVRESVSGVFYYTRSDFGTLLNLV
jgi:hypothetical protein